VKFSGFIADDATPLGATRPILSFINEYRKYLEDVNWIGACMEYEAIFQFFLQDPLMGYNNGAFFDEYDRVRTE
jgi:hypothetical protein